MFEKHKITHGNLIIILPKPVYLLFDIPMIPFSYDEVALLKNNNTESIF